jgi:TfoX/Sxy family transcriptional regulator of competence genes
VAFDEDLARRIRALLDPRADVDERRMFGGVGFLVAGNMCCGVLGEELLVRLAREDADALLASDAAVRPMDMTGRPMRGWLLVAPQATADDADLERWVRRAEEFVATLPPK